MPPFSPIDYFVAICHYAFLISMSLLYATCFDCYYFACYDAFATPDADADASHRQMSPSRYADIFMMMPPSAMLPLLLFRALARRAMLRYDSATQSA